MSPLLVIPVGLLPVLAFLGLLILLDSYKLVPVGPVLRAILAGCVAALACLALNRWLLAWLGIDAGTFSRYVAPVVEEASKAVYVLWLIRSARTGFLVDAAILGFAVGAGFAVTENLYYQQTLANPSLLIWIVRGTGTAVMHGSTTAIFAILSKGLTDRHDSDSIVWFVPGLVAACGIHSVFNHFILPPVMTTAVLLAVVPLLLVGVFQRSQEITGRWLGAGFDCDTDLLEQIVSGEIRETRVGRYLQSLRERFPGPVVADMLCLLQIHLELSLRAKGILLAREAGIQVPVGEDVRPKLDELTFLEGSIGQTGRLAIRPFLKIHRRDLWELYVLGR